VTIRLVDCVPIALLTVTKRVRLYPGEGYLPCTPEGTRCSATPNDRTQPFRKNSMTFENICRAQGPRRSHRAVLVPLPGGCNCVTGSQGKGGFAGCDSAPISAPCPLIFSAYCLTRGMLQGVPLRKRCPAIPIAQPPEPLSTTQLTTRQLIGAANLFLTPSCT
jgi:hypothetical protein